MHSNQVELLYSRAKVYLHPTKHKNDNIAGFLVLYKGPASSNKDIKLAFVPEAQLSGEIKTYEALDRDKYDKKPSKPYIVEKPHESVLSGHSFSIALGYIFSVQVRKPSYGLWHGSIVVHSKDGERLPVMFFHDSESESHKEREKQRNQNMDPFNSEGEVVWGGSEFLEALEKLVVVERSTMDRSVYLVCPEQADVRSFSAPKKENKLDFASMLATAKWKVLETVATFTSRTKNQVLDMVDEHAPVPVKKLLAQPEVQLEFDSARVYLAKWAQQVKEEAEHSSSRFMLEGDIYSRINAELGSSELLTHEEVGRTSRSREVSPQEWDSFFDHSGRLRITVDEVKSRVFHGGLAHSVRKEAWLFLLGVYPWSSSREERRTLYESYMSAYHEEKKKWEQDPQKRLTDSWKDQKHRIDKDIHRTDRDLELFKNIENENTNNGSTIENDEDSSSPPTPASEDDISVIPNPHLYCMREILLTYNEYNPPLGYVQGMTDLLSPLYVVLRDEALVFWAFSHYMERMERNFVRDQSGMKAQMSTLNRLLQFMLPDLYLHLEKCESVDLFFLFRSLLVWFKREMPWDDVLRLWEILWTDFYSGSFHLFFALAVLSENERIIVQNLRRFDEVLKYMNDLSMKLHLDPLLVRSELLFLKFKRMVDIIDRDNQRGERKVEVPDDLRELLRREYVVQKEVPEQEIPERSEGVSSEGSSSEGSSKTT